MEDEAGTTDVRTRNNVPVIFFIFAEDTTELVEAAKQVQRERREHRVKSEMEKTTKISQSQTVEVEQTNVRESQVVTVEQQNQTTTQTNTSAVVNTTTQPSYVVTKPVSTKDLLVKCKQDVSCVIMYTRRYYALLSRQKNMLYHFSNKNNQSLFACKLC